MITPVVQRWRERRATYRPAGEPFPAHHFEVAPIEDDATAKCFVVRHHYSKFEGIDAATIDRRAAS